VTSLDDIKKMLKKGDTKSAAELRQIRKNLERICALLETREERETKEEPVCSLCGGSGKVNCGYSPVPCWRCTDAEGVGW
jgi:hypothetical protein